ncbi:MAG: threonine synthase, partial [Catalinimonas sp.]
MSSSIRYHSTNRWLRPAGQPAVPPVSFATALLRGQAPDGGLYLPERLPTIDWRALRGRPYAEVAHAVLAPFLVPEMPADALLALLHEAYDFDIPTEAVDDRTIIARLDRGPTASFKDFAARAMARWMAHFRPGDQTLTVLVATSGDTGSAVGEAFRGVPGTRVVILFPDREVSSVQRAQLERIGGNVSAVVIDGKFDDCQQMVKRAFNDPALADWGLTSANSINVGRVLPQAVYYFYLYCRLADGEPLNFCIPSGNLGNSLGAELARRMGLPVGKIVVATNANDALPAFLLRGDYRPVHPSRACLSNAMNVGNPSNLARYFDLYGGTVDAAGTVHR